MTPLCGDMGQALSSVFMFKSIYAFLRCRIVINRNDKYFTSSAMSGLFLQGFD